MLKSKYIIFIIIIYNNFSAYSQNSDFNQPKLKDTLTFENSSFKLVHFYDLTNHTKQNRWHMISGNGDPFTDSNNNYSRIFLINKNDIDTLFNISCNALTNISIDTLNKMIIGISRIEYWNPFKIVIIDYNGNIVLKRDLQVMESKLSKSKLMTFKKKFPIVYKNIKRLGLIYKDSNNYYICHLGIKDSAAKSFLSRYTYFNHIFTQIKTDGNCTYDGFHPVYPFQKLICNDRIPLKLFLMDYKENVKIFTLSQDFP